MIAKLGGKQFGKQAVILVHVVPLRSEYDIWRAGPPEVAQRVLDRIPMRRRAPVREVENSYVQIRVGTERGKRRTLFGLPFGATAGKHQRAHAQARIGSRDREQSSTHSDRDVVAMRSEQRDLRDRSGIETDHA